MIYRVKNWKELFENNRTRGMKNMGWVPVPNKHDGEGFQTVMNEPDGIKIYGCWHLILQVASKCQKRGTLAKIDGTPITALTIAKKTGWDKVEDIQRALDFLSSPEVAWLEVLAHEPASKVQEGAQIRQEGAPKTHEPVTEGKGREGNGKREREGAGAGDGEAGPDEAHGILRRQPELRGLTWEQDLVARKGVAGNPKIGSKFSPWFSEAAARIADMAVLAGEIDHVGSWLRAQYAKLAGELDGPRVPAQAGGFQKNKPAGPVFDPAARCFTSHADQED